MILGGTYNNIKLNVHYIGNQLLIYNLNFSTQELKPPG